MIKDYRCYLYKKCKLDIPCYECKKINNNLNDIIELNTLKYEQVYSNFYKSKNSNVLWCDNNKVNISFWKGIK